mmetsp:Transcript_42605/g.132546  ORF Transcript_42605/g.132546 Transcript_42605/m.132546 type:complete len:202 (-) Transcript_42605:47-652(-)
MSPSRTSSPRATRGLTRPSWNPLLCCAPAAPTTTIGCCAATAGRRQGARGPPTPAASVSGRPPPPTRWRSPSSPSCARSLGARPWTPVGSCSRAPPWAATAAGTWLRGGLGSLLRWRPSPPTSKAAARGGRPSGSKACPCGPSTAWRTSAARSRTRPRSSGSWGAPPASRSSRAAGAGSPCTTPRGWSPTWSTAPGCSRGC